MSKRVNPFFYLQFPVILGELETSRIANEYHCTPYQSLDFLSDSSPILKIKHKFYGVSENTSSQTENKLGYVFTAASHGDKATDGPERLICKTTLLPYTYAAKKSGHSRNITQITLSINTHWFSFFLRKRGEPSPIYVIRNGQVKHRGSSHWVKRQGNRHANKISKIISSLASKDLMNYRPSKLGYRIWCLKNELI